MKKLVTILTISIVVVAAGVAMVWYGFKDKIMGMLDKTSYVATVGDKKITTDVYNYFLSSTKNSIEQNAGVQTDADKKSLWQTKVGNQTAEEYAKQQALDTSTTFTILLDKAKAANYKLAANEIKTSNDQIDSYVKSLGTGDTATKAFEAEYGGLTPEKVKSISLDLALVQKFYTEEEKKITTSDDELKKYYDENAETYKQVTVRHVLFMTIDQTTNQPLSQDKQDEAKKKAEDILAKVKAGADIGALAKQYSEDPGSKDNNGEYTFAKGQMVQQFEDWSFNAKVGDVGLVKTDYGYHVIELMKILGYDDVKDAVKASLVSKKFNDQINSWKKSSQYTLVKNSKILSTIKVME